MAYQAIPPVNRGGTDPAAVALRRAQSLLGTTVTRVFGTEFDNDQWYRTTGATGTGAATITTTDRGGVLNVASGATANSGITVLPHGTTCSIGNPQTDLWYCNLRSIITTAIDAQASAEFRITTPSVGNGQITFGVTGSVSTSFFSYRVITNAGVITSAATTVSIDTAYHLWEIWGNATSIFFGIDGVQVASTAVANMGTNPVTPGIVIGNGTTAAARTLKADYVFVCCVPPAS